MKVEYSIPPLEPQQFRLSGVKSTIRREVRWEGKGSKGRFVFEAASSTK